MPIAFFRRKTITAGVLKTAGMLALGVGLLLQAPGFSAQANEKYAAFVIDANNGKVLFNRYGDEARYPASLTKMMTLYMMFEALETGRAQTSTPMKVSAYAAARPPSKLGLKAGSTLTVHEAMHSLVTRSANDAAVVIGEFLGGTEARFAEMMTAKARSLGMKNTTFKNANGLPNAGQVTTARDMASLGIALREHFPQYYKIFSTRQFDFRGQKIGNHNRLLGRVEGVDGIKTGYINASGFNLTTSIVRGNKKLVAVVMGGRSGASRDNHMAELIKQYLPMASEGRGAPLVASWSPSNSTGARAAPSAAAPAVARVAAAVPASVPIPTLRAESIDQRVASAYGSNAASAVDALTSPSGRPLVGREALRNALVPMRSAPTLDLPTANSLASTGPIPPAAIPRPNVDRRPTGSIASQVLAAVEAPAATSARSPWVVQIAATPTQATALDMLNEAKRQVGSALSGAEAFTETVDAGSQTLYRARFAGFETKGAATAACEALKRSSYACYAIAN